MTINKTVSISTHMEASHLVTGQLGRHTILIDQPVATGGQDQGPSPLEYFLFSVAGCLSSIARIAAMQKKIVLHHINFTVDGGLNSAVLMGKLDQERAGFQSIAIRAEIDAELSDEEKQQFLDEICRRCPVHDNITNASLITHSLS
ncbi:MAG: OsmC family protein [Endozoicomonadaceae bacterium]|nr:OsmC family protein [Endozoicomonadaceae bacterium]